MKLFALLVILSVVVLCGCEELSHEHPTLKVLPPALPPMAAATAAPDSYFTPTNLSILISNADHILITNRLAYLDPRLAGFSLLISGSDARQIVKAVSSSKAYPNSAQSAAIWDWELQFYSHTNYLTTLLFQESFLFENNEWHDETGVLKKLDDELCRRTTP